MGWKAPASFGGMMFRGVAVMVDERGFVDFSDMRPDEVEALCRDLPCHGFAPVEGDDPQPAAPEGFEPAAITIDGLSVLKRGELFALLKSLGAPQQPPISNDDLREAARVAIEARPAPTPTGLSRP